MRPLHLEREMLDERTFVDWQVLSHRIDIRRYHVN